MHKEKLFFFLMVVLAVLPVWIVTFFPSQDGPIHLWIMHLISSYHAPDAQLQQQLIEPNRAIEPNMGFYVVAWPLSLLFGVALAEKLYITFMTFVFCYGVRYAIANINNNAMALSYLSIPIAFNSFTHMGFYNFILGIALFLPLITFCILQYHRENFRYYWKIGIVGLILAFIHLMSFVVFVFTLGLYVLSYRTADALKTGKLLPSTRKLAWESGMLAVVLLPGALFILSFFSRHGVEDNPAESSYPLKYYSELFYFTFLKSFAGIEEWLIGWPYLVVVSIAIALVAGSLYRHRHVSTQAIAIFIMSIGLLLLYLHAPITSSDIPLNPRLAPFVVLAGILVLAAFSGKARLTLVMVLSGAIIIGGSGYRYFQYHKFDQEIKQLLSIAEHITPYSTFLPIRFEHDLPPFNNSYRYFQRANPMLHASAHIAVQRQAIYLRSSLMSPSRYGYFPFIFRHDSDPFVLLGDGIEGYNPRIDFAQFRQATGNSIDYIILIGSTSKYYEATNSAGSVEQIHHELKNNYRWSVSSENGRYHLYERKDLRLFSKICG